jgi:hypothetical protein
VSTKSVRVRWSLWSGRRLSKRYRLRVKTAPTAAALSADSSSSASAYEVSQRLIREAPWVDAALVSGTTSEHDVEGLDGSMQVQVQVAAQNEAGWGGWSQPALTETLPLAPTLVFIQEVRAEEVELKWTPPAGARLEYSIIPMLWENGAYQDQAAVIKNSGTLDSFGVGPLFKGRNYVFRVAVCLDSGEGEGGGVGDYSALSNDVKTLSTLPSPGPAVFPDLTPEVLGVASTAPVTASSVRLRWNPIVPWQDSGGTGECVKDGRAGAKGRQGGIEGGKMR